MYICLTKCLPNTFRGSQLKKTPCKLPKLAKRCQKLPQSSKSCQKLPKAATNAKSCQKLPQSAKSCQKLPQSVEELMESWQNVQGWPFRLLTKCLPDKTSHMNPSWQNVQGRQAKSWQNVQGRQAILTKCHPDNMSSWQNVCWPAKFYSNEHFFSGASLSCLQFLLEVANW